jgi:uncharacterized CHY-type Zn-finger protein
MLNEFFEGSNTSVIGLLALGIIWCSLCLPELVFGVILLLTQGPVDLISNQDAKYPVLVAFDVETEIEESEIPEIIAYDVDASPKPILIVCTHCEHLYLEFEEVSEILDCPNCSHLVVPLEDEIKTTMNFPLVYNSLTLQHVDFVK